MCGGACDRTPHITKTLISRHCLFSENGEMLCEHFVKMNGVLERELDRKRKLMTLDAYFSL